MQSPKQKQKNKKLAQFYIKTQLPETDTARQISQDISSVKN